MYTKDWGSKIGLVERQQSSIIYFGIIHSGLVQDDCKSEIKPQKSDKSDKSDENDHVHYRLGMYTKD